MRKKKGGEQLHMLRADAWVLFSIYLERSAHRTERCKSSSLSKQALALSAEVSHQGEQKEMRERDTNG